MAKITPVIMAGGQGRRLRPLSTSINPKQFLKVYSEYSPFQEVVLRNSSFGKPLVISSDSTSSLVLSQLKELNIECKIINEPTSKNTLSCALIAALQIEDKDSIILLAPADHYISNELLYHDSIKEVTQRVENDNIALLGIPPLEPHIGYGYIKSENEKVVSFVEKPDYADAVQYIKEGYLWNSGIFAFKASHLLSLAQEKAPEILNICRSANQGSSCQDGVKILGKAYHKLPEIPLDKALIESHQNLTMIRAQFDWCDLGCWKNILSLADKAKLAQIIYTNYLAERDVLLLNKEFHQKPWGGFYVLKRGDNFQLKKLIIAPFQQTSLQYHNYRSEYGVIVRGNLELVIDKSKKECARGDFFDIPEKTIHQLLNNSNVEVHVIEVQVGEIIEETDIVRLEDIYGRV